MGDRQGSPPDAPAAVPLALIGAPPRRGPPGASALFIAPTPEQLAVMERKRAAALALHAQVRARVPMPPPPPPPMLLQAPPPAGLETVELTPAQRVRDAAGREKHLLR
jgi:hypothetical protein